jgi:3-oxoacyl-[acyl-carrier-protein] synthase-1
VVETAALLHEMRHSTLVASKGYNVHGVSKPLNVITETTGRELSVCLKMASGFGGSNAALIIQKI